MTFNENWTTPRPREGQYKDMGAPSTGVPHIKVKDAADFIYLLLNFVAATGGLRGQWVGKRYLVTSYGTPIGLRDGQRTFLNSTEYSATTERHKNIVKDAWGDVYEASAENFPEL